MEEEVRGVIGWLGVDGALYCSRSCAARSGSAGAREIDVDAYDALTESEALAPESSCPACGAEFPVPWPERERG